VTTLLVVGTGLIGGSFALAARRAGSVARVIGFDRSAAALTEAQRRGIVDAAAADLADGVAAADVVFVAVPTGSTGAVLADVFGFGPAPSQVVFDGASVKRAVIDDLRRRLGTLPSGYVPAHPMAGSERHGPAAASVDLFADCDVFVTPEPETSAAAVERVAGLWRSVGARVREASGANHDAMVALTSHLPHLVAYAYMRVVAEHLMPDSPDDPLLPYAGPGFRDFTRIAGSDAAMWRQIVEANRGPVTAHLDALTQVLARLRSQIASDRFDELQAELEVGRRAYRSLSGADANSGEEGAT
jgi:prephenate dehydrogenase